MSDSQNHSAGDETENKGGANRRRVLQGIGAAGVATAVAGKASADGQSGQFSQAAAEVSADHDEIPTSAQFWSFRDSDLSTAELVYEMDEAGYDHFEPYSISEDSDTEAINEAIDDTGVTMESAHQGVGDVLDDPDGVAEMYLEYGEPALIEAYIGGWDTEEDVLDIAHDINEAADLMADHGLEFGYHNHDHEFEQIEDGDEIAFDIFAEEVEDHVHLQIDAGWVLTGGEDPIHYIVEYADLVESIHMKNMRDGDFVEIDEGEVGMRGVATAARNAADVDLLVYEHDAPEDPLESLETGGYWMNKLNHPYSPGGICAIPGADTHPAKLQ
ncbi:sugar phosphate isomerase/epimerase [Halobacteria archaeon AArc-dxtr1]|nr:sugar phosphate isomerase/epimerase [Halobacteria archaeon AArc-dxtr1]